jgi:hypothetical protein
VVEGLTIGFSNSLEREVQPVTRMREAWALWMFDLATKAVRPRQPQTALKDGFSSSMRSLERTPGSMCRAIASGGTGQRVSAAESEKAG